MEVNYISAPYKRKYKHTKSKGSETSVICSYCGRKVPKWKSFSVMKRFNIGDPVLRKQIDMRRVGMFSRKSYACPSCARHRGIVQIGKSRKSRTSTNR